VSSLLTPVMLLAVSAHAFNLNRLQLQASQLKAINQQRETAPAQDQPKLQAQREQLVTEIRGAAEAEPKDYAAQYAVARGLLSAKEEAHATVYADRAVEVAQEAGDKKKESDALTLAAVAYQKVGDLGTANDRAKKALWIDPKNPTALQVLLTTKDRLSGGQGRAADGLGAQPVGKDAPLPPVTAATSGSGRSGYGDGAAQAPAIQFVGADTQKAAKLMGEAQRTWTLDRKAALKLFDEAVAADAKSAAVRAARARARLEMKDYAGALEDATESLAGGPSGEASFVRAVALKALGGKEADIKAAYDAAAAADPRYVADYQSYIAALGRDEGAQGGASAPASAPAMRPESEPAANLLLLGAVGALALALVAAAVLLRRRREEG
jgi:tetratricopeptide (TPR) repeat protein